MAPERKGASSPPPLLKLPGVTRREEGDWDEADNPCALGFSSVVPLLLCFFLEKNKLPEEKIHFFFNDLTEIISIIRVRNFFL